MTAAQRCAARSTGFTLLEVLAVILIGAVLMSITVPNLGALQSRALREHAQRLVAKIDLGRQRAVVTGAAHRIFIDVDSGAYGLEAEGGGEPLDPPSAATDFVPDKPLSLEPPPLAERAFAPIPGVLGHTEWLGETVAFAGIETGGSWVRSGEVFVRFERDGTSSQATIVLDDPDGNELSLLIRPLAETVRITDEAR